MSTKIYNGYRIDSLDGNGREITFGGLVSRLRPFRRRIQEALRREYGRVLGSLTAEIIDAAALRLPCSWNTDADTGSPLVAAMMHLSSRQDDIKRTQHRDPEVDFECQVCLIPYAGKIFALLYTEREPFQRIWEETDGVSPYPYWNNTDRPKRVTENEWEQRRIDWDGALKMSEGAGVPALAGMMFDAIADQMPFLHAKDLLAFIPDVASRVEHWAKVIATDEWFNARKPPGERPAHEWGRMLSECREWLGTSAGMNRLTAIRAETTHKLNHSLTPDDLTKDVKSIVRNPTEAS